jgi:hypothetical protein
MGLACLLEQSWISKAVVDRYISQELLVAWLAVLQVASRLREANREQPSQVLVLALVLGQGYAPGPGPELLEAIVEHEGNATAVANDHGLDGEML